uniref:Uncharacterized protein n=1 Tax=Chromera velia CCMP2878 TaxID=1169474 RepID=A0A0G4HTA9_9ALVE|eukprot:Cvel_8442.t1-p1 / transcript=Cvel_8442.t1 / gene=Cvel_8442 / organism=Chromera_velia_CCMP2878 / gene_product=hypothetical protein / transcript_product=hypothetical protein / location=Cvel_scaffold466:27290-29031(-) / protein_length=308 / sequence_SO=supercontig / SO=protein_coding / is_pseudo=false
MSFQSRRRPQLPQIQEEGFFFVSVDGELARASNKDLRQFEVLKGHPESLALRGPKLEAVENFDKAAFEAALQAENRWKMELKHFQGVLESVGSLRSGDGASFFLSPGLLDQHLCSYMSLKEEKLFAAVKRRGLFFLADLDLILDSGSRKFDPLAVNSSFEFRNLLLPADPHGGRQRDVGRERRLYRRFRLRVPESASLGTQSATIHSASWVHAAQDGRPLLVKVKKGRDMKPHFMKELALRCVLTGSAGAFLACKHPEDEGRLEEVHSFSREALIQTSKRAFDMDAAMDTVKKVLSQVQRDLDRYPEG